MRLVFNIFIKLLLTKSSPIQFKRVRELLLNTIFRAETEPEESYIGGISETCKMLG